MSLQKQSTSAKKPQADVPDKRRVVSLIGLAANLDDPLYHRKLSVMLEELESINATRTEPPRPRGSRVLRHYIE